MVPSKQIFDTEASIANLIIDIQAPSPSWYAYDWHFLAQHCVKW